LRDLPGVSARAITRDASDVIARAGQALRDKFAHTYVIRRDAVPTGTGRIAYAHYTLLGTSYLFKEVRSSQSVAAP